MTDETVNETGAAEVEHPVAEIPAAVDGQSETTGAYEDISSLLHDYHVMTTAKGGKILDVDLPRKRLSVELSDGTHALVGAPESFFVSGNNANVGDYYVVDTSNIPHHVHESIFANIFTKVTNVLTGDEQN